MLHPLFWVLLASSGGDSIDLPFTWCNPQPQGHQILGMEFFDDLHGVAVGDLGAVLVTSDGGSTWNIPNGYTGLGLDLHDVLMLDADSLLVAGESPGLFRSDDAGETWAVVPNPSTAGLFSLERAGTSALSAAGEDGQVLRSVDGGLTWNLTASLGTEAVFEQAWLDTDTGFAVGTFIAKRTDDGGQTWVQIDGMPMQDFYTAVDFLDDGVHGYVTASLNNKYHTNDGGMTWILDASQGPHYPAELVLLSPSDRLVSLDGEGAQVWRTTDNGANWTELLQLDFTIGLPAFVQLSGGRLIAGSAYGDLLYSDDLGASWTNAIHNPDQGSAVPISAMAFTPLGHGFAGSSPSTSDNEPIWLETTDGGANWALPAASPEVGRAGAVEFRGEDWGLAGGTMPNRIAWTLDGGTTWNHETFPVPSGVSLRVNALAMPSDTVAFAATSSSGGGALFRTDDRGATWQSVGAGIPVNASIYDVDFPSEMRGYVIKGGTFGSAQLYRTLDGGANWSAMPVLPSSPADFVFLDDETGLITSWNPTPGIWRTDDGGVSWQKVHDQAIELITFSDPLRGMASPKWSTSMVEAVLTLDGGLTWRSAPVPLGGPAMSLRAVPGAFFMGGHGTRIVRLDPPETWLGLDYCFGDGTGTPCPCGNEGAESHGCANSTHSSGARLFVTGSPTISNDTIVLHATASAPSQPGLFFQGDLPLNGGNGQPFGDGLRCIGNGVRRLEIVMADATGTSQTSVSISIAGGVSAGQLKEYQLWYRDPHNGPCSSNFNLTNAHSVIWNP